jgi:hypothetical protein
MDWFYSFRVGSLICVCVCIYIYIFWFRVYIEQAGLAPKA